MTRKKYSVLMSLYNGEKPEYLRPSIDSMLNQSIQPDEIVLVLDGPINENLRRIVEDYVSTYKNIFKIVILKKNVGLGKALNEGLKVCSNNLIARMDTDDISLPDRCEKQLNTFKNQPNLSIVGSNIDEFSIEPSKIISSRRVPSTHEEIIKFSKMRNPFNHPSVMYKKRDILKSGGYGDYRRNQDYELFVRMLHEGYEAKNINESLVLFRANDDNLQRRKSWNKTKSDIEIRYNFWKKEYINFSDLVLTSLGFITLHMMPNKLFSKISKLFLRSDSVNS